MVTEQRKRALALFSDKQDKPQTVLGMEAERIDAMRAKSEKLKALRLETQIAGIRSASRKSA